MADNDQIRWAQPSPVSNVFTNEQAARVQAMRAATEVTLHLQQRGALGVRVPYPADEQVAFILTIAQWIIDPATLDHSEADPWMGLLAQTGEIPNE